MRDIIYRTGTNCTTYFSNRPYQFLAIHYVASASYKIGSIKKSVVDTIAKMIKKG